MAIKKAIFVVAGFGTRFLPATKAQPKEMLPIVDKPIIQYLVEEATEAGIEEIIFITGRGKNSIENHFDKGFELEITLSQKNKLELLKEVQKIDELAHFAYVRQPEQKGDGHALLCARPFIDPNESILVVFPDYLMPKSNKSIRKIIEIYNEKRDPVICADSVPREHVSKYGVIDFEPTENEDIVKVNAFVEKPEVEKAPSNLINAGYFIITPEVIKYLENSQSTAGDGEIRVADALVAMTQDNKPIYALKPQKPGYDCGDKIGFLKATVDIALQRKDIKDDFYDFLKQRIEELENSKDFPPVTS
jgi:UTP--glucose-1-phosphate uridylyltransferase